MKKIYFEDLLYWNSFTLKLPPYTWASRLCLVCYLLETLLWPNTGASLPSRGRFWAVSGMPTWSLFYPIPLQEHLGAQRPGIPFLEGLNLLPGPTHASSLTPLSSSSPGLTRLLGCSLRGSKCTRSGFRGIWLWTVSVHYMLRFPVHVCEAFPVQDGARPSARVGVGGEEHLTLALGLTNNTQL